MATRIFLSVPPYGVRFLPDSKADAGYRTGASGYLGGEALYQLASRSAKPVIRIRCLVRDAQKGAAITKAFPNVDVVQGDLDDAALIEREAHGAGVVVHLASTKHDGSARAIAAGLASEQREKLPGHWIQISGASMFSTPEIKANTYGKGGEKRFDDVADVAEVIDVIRSNPARTVDNLVLDQDSAVKTALIPGPLIYGTGRGPINTRSIQGPESARYALQKGHAFTVGDGQAAWSNVHVSDVGALIVLLVEAALDGRQGLWNQEGIYFPENGLMTFGDIAKRIVNAAVQSGRITASEVKSLSPEEVNEITPHGAVLLGTNARVVSSRARRDLGWKPAGHSLADEIPVMVAEESKRL